MENKTNFKVGDQVLVSPQVTGEKEWIEATIIEVEQNPFVGIVITVETDDKNVFFEKEDMFKPLTEKVCLQ
jgi:hypothetical protein